MTVALEICPFKPQRVLLAEATKVVFAEFDVIETLGSPLELDFRYVCIPPSPLPLEVGLVGRSR